MFFESFLLNIAVLVILIVALTFDFITKFFTYWYIRHVPYKTPIPCFGSDLQRVLGFKTTTDVVTRLYEQHPNEKFVGYIKSRIPDLLVRDLDSIELILSTDFGYFHRKGLCLERSEDVCIKNNLFYAEGEKWKLVREMMESFFKYSPWKLNWINHDIPLLSGEINVNDIVSNFLDKLITINLFTTEDSKHTGKHVISKIREKLQKPSFVDRIKNYMKVIFPSLYVTFGFNVIPGDLRKSIKRVLRKHSESIVISKFMDIKNICESKIYHKQMISGGSDDDLMTSFVCSFINEAYIPTYNVITATLYELSKNATIQEKARNVVTTQWNNILDFHTCEDNYLDSVISEAMRLYPPYTTINRVCVKAYKFPESGMLIDKGVTITVPVAAIHRDSKYYTDPEEFDPSRFFPEARQKQHAYSYMPFGAGPRKCVGENLSRWMIRVTIAAFLRTYRLERCSGTSARLNFVDNGHARRLSHNVWLKMTPLNNSVQGQ